MGRKDERELREPGRDHLVGIPFLWETEERVVEPLEHVLLDFMGHQRLVSPRGASPEGCIQNILCHAPQKVFDFGGAPLDGQCARVELGDDPVDGIHL